MSSEESSTIGRSGAYAKGIARRQEILGRAIEVFAERGAERTSLRRIAQELGVSHATLLHYFDSREQLLVAVYEHAEFQRTGGGSPVAQGHALDIMVDAAVQNVKVPGLVQLYSTLVAAALEAGSTASKEFFTDRFHQVRDTLARELRHDQESGLVRKDVDADAISALIVAASDGLQIQWLLEPSLRLQETLQAFATLLAPPAATVR